MLRTLVRTGALLRAPPSSPASALLTTASSSTLRPLSSSAHRLARSTRERKPVAQVKHDSAPAPAFPPGSAGGAIQTIPFQLAPDAALRVSETAAASAFGVQNVFRLLASRFLQRWFGFALDDEIRQIAFTPLLVPVWKVDLAMRGKALVGDVQMQLNSASTFTSSCVRGPPACGTLADPARRARSHRPRLVPPRLPPPSPQRPHRLAALRRRTRPVLLGRAPHPARPGHHPRPLHPPPARPRLQAQGVPAQVFGAGRHRGRRRRARREPRPKELRRDALCGVPDVPPAVPRRVCARGRRGRAARHDGGVCDGRWPGASTLLLPRALSHACIPD